MEEISLREIIEVVLKGKWLIALITIVVLILTGIGTYIMLPGTQSVVAIIELNYPGIEKGENPDGSKFDIRQLTSPYVIEKALEKTGLDASGVKPDEVRRNIDITSIVPNDIVQIAETMLKQGKDYVYYPSEFKIIYKVNKAFSYNQGITLVEAIGKLMFESGESSINKYECGCPELISIFRILKECKGVYGARFSGAGYRGCCIGLIDPDYKESIKETVAREYPRLHPKYREMYRVNFCKTSDGAAFINNF